MNLNYFFLLIVLALAGCKEAPQQNQFSAEENDSTEQTDKATEQNTGDLAQQGDYSSLFNSPDCNVISAEEISTALGLTVTDMGIKGRCSFESKFPNSRTWYLTIARNDMSKSDIQREIATFKSDETGQLALQISETGDTYFCIQHSNGYLSIYNPNYNGSVLIQYGSVGESRGFSKEERLEHRALAVKLANTLLKDAKEK
ncbi:hypothetical protein [Lewinella sp. LCG006]|uniref:hypothetical protein n=1 Tax=Lewinella sp. LCG006 TaxID=3231911 RepID=UPI00345F617B